MALRRSKRLPAATAKLHAIVIGSVTARADDLPGSAQPLAGLHLWHQLRKRAAHRYAHAHAHAHAESGAHDIPGAAFVAGGGFQHVESPLLLVVGAQQVHLGAPGQCRLEGDDGRIVLGNVDRMDIELRQSDAVFLHLGLQRFLQEIRQGFKLGGDFQYRLAVLNDRLGDMGLDLGGEHALEIIGQRGHIKGWQGADQFQQKFLGIDNLDPVLPESTNRHHDLELRVLQLDRIGGSPADFQIGGAVDVPDFGGKGRLAAKRDADQRAQHGQVFGRERMPPGTERPLINPALDEVGLLRFIDDQLGPGR